MSAGDGRPVLAGSGSASPGRVKVRWGEPISIDMASKDERTVTARTGMKALPFGPAPGDVGSQYDVDGSLSPPGVLQQVLLSDLLDGGVPIAWHEAVAVVRVLGLSVLHQAPPVELPRPTQIQIGTDGSLRVLDTDVVGHDALPRLRDLLGTLLDERVAPPELVSLLRDSPINPSPANATEFVERLTFFARPDDRVELATLATRGAAFRESRLRDEALASLTRKARVTSANAETPPPPRKRPVSTSIRGGLLVAGLLVLTFCGVLAWRAVPQREGGSDLIVAPAQQLAWRVQDQVASGVTALQQHLGLAPDEEAAGGRDRTLSAIPRRPQRPTVIDERAPLPAEYAYGLVARDERVAVPEKEVGGATVVPPMEWDRTIYSAEDSSVTAPTLSRPQMPTERIEGISQERAGELELLVGVDGRVEQAKLVPASNRHQDRMMVSAAKTWRFEPAIKDGQKVPYRLRMPITW